MLTQHKFNGFVNSNAFWACSLIGAGLFSLLDFMRPLAIILFLIAYYNLCFRVYAFAKNSQTHTFITQVLLLAIPFILIGIFFFLDKSYLNGIIFTSIFSAIIIYIVKRPLSRNLKLDLDFVKDFSFATLKLFICTIILIVLLQNLAVIKQKISAQGKTETAIQHLKSTRPSESTEYLIKIKTLAQRYPTKAPQILFAIANYINIHNKRKFNPHLSTAIKIYAEILNEIDTSGITIPFQNINLYRPQFTNLDLQNIHFYDSRFQLGFFQNSNLTNTKFINNFLKRSNFENATLKGSTFKFTTTLHSNFNNADLSNSNMRQNDFSKTSFINANFQDSLLVKSSFIRSNLKGANLNSANISRTNFQHADLSRARINKSNLTAAKLRHSILREASLRDSKLIKANLSKADLTGSILSGAILTNANLSGADLTGADLTGADLTGADLTNAILKKANQIGRASCRERVCHRV